MKTSSNLYFFMFPYHVDQLHPFPDAGFEEYVVRMILHSLDCEEEEPEVPQSHPHRCFLHMMSTPE